MSLLEEALKQETVPKIDAVTPEQIELAIAWAEGTVTTGACARAIKKKPTAAIVLIARFLQAAVREGKLKRTKEKP